MLFGSAPSITRAIVAALLLIVASSLPSAAQGTRGKEFWGGFMYNINPDGELPDLLLFVTSPVNTTGVLQIPRAGLTQNFGVPANVGTLIRVPAAFAMSLGSEGVENKAFRVVTLDTAEVYALNYLPKTADASIVMAVEALGTEYLAITYNASPRANGTNPAEFIVIAVEDSTLVEITPTNSTRGGKVRGVPFSILLNAGQVFQVQSDSDLTGTRVRSLNGRRFAFVSGSAGPNIPEGVPSTDHCYEQLLPTERWGTYFIAVPLLTRYGDTYRVVAGTDNTTINVDGMAPFTLNAGEYREFVVKEPSVIRSDKTIEVAQFSNSSAFDFVTAADPAMTMLSPADFVRHEITFECFPKANLQRHYVNIVTLNVALDQITLDGVPIASSFQPVPGDPYYAYARIVVSAGSHHLSSLWGMNAYVYGYGDAEAYLYNTGSDNLSPCPGPAIRALGDTVFCRGDSVILDAGPGYKTYLWSNGATTQQISATADGFYSVITLDTNGCRRPSRPVHVTVHDPPSVAIASNPDVPICPCDSAILAAPPGMLRYRWTTGDTTERIVAHTAGTYGVSVTNGFGCVDSATTTVAVRNVQPTVAVGAAGARSGSLVSLPIYIVNSADVVQCGLREFTTSVQYNGSVLHFAGVEGATVISDTWAGASGMMRELTISGVRGGDTLARLQFTAALGDTETTAVLMGAFRWDRCAVVRTDVQSGTFVLLDICRVGSPRLIDLNGGTRLKRAYPNPARRDMTVEYDVGEKGRCELFVTDLLGRRVLQLADAEMVPGAYAARLESAGLPVGAYICVLATPHERVTAMIHVMR